jgi:transcriptional regulator with XRE-family HTH domain
MLTEFGRFLRKLRIDCGELIKDMAEKLNVTSSYLSAIETGKRNIPDSWVDKITYLYNLDSSNKNSLQEAAGNSAKAINLPIKDMGINQKKTAILFAREFPNLDEEQLKQIRKLLKKDNEGG